MADEAHTSSHRLYQRRFNLSLARQDFSRDTIFDSAIQRLDALVAVVGDAKVFASVGIDIAITSDLSTVPTVSVAADWIIVTG